MRRPRTFAALPGLLMLIVGLIAAFAPPAYAQRQLGAIQGTITDQTGGVLPGVTVTATNKSTGEVRTTITNEVGIYRLQSLDPWHVRRAGSAVRLRPGRPRTTSSSPSAPRSASTCADAGGRDRNRAGARACRLTSRPRKPISPRSSSGSGSWTCRLPAATR